MESGKPEDMGQKDSANESVEYLWTVDRAEERAKHADLVDLSSSSDDPIAPPLLTQVENGSLNRRNDSDPPLLDGTEGERNKRVKLFSEVTGTDPGVAQDIGKQECDSGHGSDSRSTQVKEPSSTKRIRLISWNLDGLDPSCLEDRTDAAMSVLLHERPHVVFLQEIVHQTSGLIETALSDFTVFFDAKIDYYNAIAVRRDCSTNLARHEFEEFTSSQMQRSLLTIKVDVCDVPVQLMTSHLESMRDHSAERVRQLSTCFDRMSSTDEHRVAIFGGDLNLRDEEVVAGGGLPANVVDVWDAAGASSADSKITWEPRKNSNITDKASFLSRAFGNRFDRIYLRKVEHVNAEVATFRLIGKDKIAGPSSKYPSDHWGVLVDLVFVAKS